MFRGIAVLAVAAALSGCTGGSTEELKTRARLHLSGEEGYLGCPALTVRRLERQGVAFSGTVQFERPNPDNPDRVNWAIEVDHWYSRDYAEVMVIQPTSDIALGYFSGTVARSSSLIEDGERLLVAGHSMTPKGPAADGTELVGFADSCLTRRWSADIAEQYEQAFPG